MDPEVRFVREYLPTVWDEVQLTKDFANPSPLLIAETAKGLGHEIIAHSQDREAAP